MKRKEKKNTVAQRTPNRNEYFYAICYSNYILFYCLLISKFICLHSIDKSGKDEDIFGVEKLRLFYSKRSLRSAYCTCLLLRLPAYSYKLYAILRPKDITYLQGDRKSRQAIKEFGHVMLEDLNDGTLLRL
ncbi:hypothetical protein GQX74_000895 [Glossina fuscipes]|nr:hypothetical protein GQX74_000895 [Glossina fuscipes]